MQEQAKQLREAANPQLVQGVANAFPDPSMIGCRHHFEPEWVLAKVPQDLDAKLSKLQYLLAQQQAHLASDIARYGELRLRKLDALSDFDVVISSSSDPVGALYTALGLKTAHITYANSSIAAIQAALDETQQALQILRPQLALF